MHRILLKLVEKGGRRSVRQKQYLTISEDVKGLFGGMQEGRGLGAVLERLDELHKRLDDEERVLTAAQRQGDAGAKDKREETRNKLCAVLDIMDHLRAVAWIQKVRQLNNSDEKQLPDHVSAAVNSVLPKPNNLFAHSPRRRERIQRVIQENSNRLLGSKDEEERNAGVRLAYILQRAGYAAGDNQR